MKKRFLALLMTVVMLFQITVITPHAVFAEVTDTSVSAEGQKEGTDVPTLRADSGLTVLAFTSDTHNQSNNTAANRLGTWLDKVAGIYGKTPDVMAFGGDMADAGASESSYWSYTQSDINQLTSRNVIGVYTTGNHEWNPGNYSSTSSSVKQQFKVGAEGKEGTNYRIYCLGSSSGSQSYSSTQISSLRDYLNSVGNDKPIFIITHFPLHFYSNGSGSWGGWGMGDRSTGNASDVIDVLNSAANGGKKIVFLWGHNHTLSDTYYDEIYTPGYELEYANGSKKTIQFYYGGAGCMSDQEYGSGSASVRGKGLVVTINSKNQLSFTYYDANVNDVTEGGTLTEQDPVAATAISIDPSAVTVMARKTTKLSVVFTPSDATNQGITWSSSDENIVTVDDTGKIKGEAPGSAIVTAVSKNGNVSATCQVAVTENTSTGTTYILADSIEEGGEYLIVSSKADGNAYALRNPGATSSGASLAAAQVTISGETIETEAEDIIWTAEPRLSGFTLTNGENAILAGKGGEAKIYTLSSDPYADRYWFYDGTYLLYKGGEYTYELYYENGAFKDTSFNSGNPSHPVYIYERVSAPAPVSGVTLDKSTLNIKIGRTGSLTATVLPRNAQNKSVTWSSDNPSVATVSNGVVTGVSKGTATITVETAEGGYTAICSVNVSEVTGTTYVLTDSFENGKKYLIANGKTGSVYVLSNEAGSEARQLKGISAEVEGDSITLEDEIAEKAEFTAEIRTSSSGAVSAWLKNGGKYLYTNSADGLRMVESSEQGSTDNTAKVWHYKADGKDLLWYFKDTSSSDGYSDISQTYKYYLECNSGVFTDNHVSTTSLSNTNNLPKIYIFVEDDSIPAPVSGVELDKTSLTIKTGRTASLTATVLPRNAQNKSVTWSSSNNAVATVSNGVVTGVASGTAKITVKTAEGGYTATCTVTVADVTGTTYVLANMIEDGGDYLLVSSKTDGSAYALRNPGATSSGASLAAAQVTVSGETIETDSEDIVWTAAARLSGFTLMNGDNAILAGKNATPGIYTLSSDPYADRYWTYDGTYLLYKGGSYTYEFYYENNGFTVRSYNSGNPSHPVYIYERVSAPVHEHVYGEPEWIWHIPETGTKAVTRAVEGVSATAVFTCSECGATLEIEADGDSITKTVDAVTGDTIYTASVKGPDGTEHSGEKTVKAEVEKKYKITITADKTMVSSDDDEVTFTLSLGPADYFGFTQMVIQIEPKDSGLTYIGNSFKIADGVQQTLGFDNITWTEQSHMLNGYASAKDYSSEEEIVLGTFKCAIGEDFTGSARVTIDRTTFEVVSCVDDSYHAPEYEIVYAEITNHEHVNGEASYEWTGNDENGYTSVKGSIICTVCGAEVVTEEVVPTFEETTPATCTTAGAGVWTATFTKEGLTNQTKNVEIPVGGHDWKFIRFTWTKTESGYTAVANYECKNDETHTDTVEASVTVETTPATCEESGESVYTATVSEEASLDGKDHEGSRIVEIPATGHDWDDPTYVWADDNSSVTATRICKNDGSHTQTETVNATSEDTTPATCTTAGVKTWTSAAFTNTAFTVQTITEEIPATDHDWKFVDVDWTETGSGYTAVANYECKNDEEHKNTADMTVTSEEGEGSDAGFIVYTATLEEADSPDGQEHTAVKRVAVEYQIDYVLNGGSNPAEVPVSYTIKSDPVTLPVPSREGYGFGGWFEAEDLSGNSVTAIATGSTGNKTFYAKWIANACTITWKLYDDNVISTAESYGTAWADVAKPEDPTREGYTFAGWTGNPETITADVDITATWTVNQYTITFDTDGGSAVEPITADYGAAITVPTDPTKEGFIFKGWSPAIPATMPAENLTIKAIWTIDEFTLTFDTDGGSAVAPITAAYGAAVTAPADPTKEGYTFKGWSPAIPATMPAENMTVKATWEINQYTIIFNTDGGSAVEPITADYGAEITAPADPTKTGYTFKAWSPALPATMPAENITVKATWTVNKYTITFNTDGGSEVASITANYGAKITAPADPTKEGYTFKSWSPAIPATMPAENMTIKATWTINKYTVTWKNDDGTVLETDKNVLYGATPTYDGATPTKAATAQYTYKFKAWSPKITAVKANTTYTATYTKTINQYTVKFVDYDGTVLKNAVKYDYGTKWADVAKPAEPARAGYVFTGWTGYTSTVTKNITVKATYKALSYVMSNNITFEGALTFNAYTVLSDEVLADDGAYMQITYTTAPTPTSAKVVTEKVLVKNAKISEKNGVKRRIFTVPFFIAQLNDEVTMKLYSSSGKEMPIGRLVSGEIVDMTKTGVVDTPWAYLDRIIDNPNSNPTMVELAKKSKIYGTAAQLHFKYHTDLLPKGATSELEKAIAGTSIATALSKYTETTTGTLPAGIERYTKQIVFEADHSLKYFIYLDGTVDISKYTFEVDDGSGNFRKVTPVKVADSKYSIQKENIPSGYLSKKYSYRISDGTNTFVITSSGLAYANTIVTKNANPTMVTLVKAMYLYSVAAEKHFKISN